MALRNPTFSVYGTAYPANVYEIKNRFVEDQDTFTNIKVYLRSYTDGTKMYSPTEHDFWLTGLPIDASLLTPALYQTKLLEQHGDKVIDGTQLSEFIVL